MAAFTLLLLTIAKIFVLGHPFKFSSIIFLKVIDLHMTKFPRWLAMLVGLLFPYQL